MRRLEKSTTFKTKLKIFHNFVEFLQARDCIHRAFSFFKCNAARVTASSQNLFFFRPPKGITELIFQNALVHWALSAVIEESPEVIRLRQVRRG